LLLRSHNNAVVKFSQAMRFSPRGPSALSKAMGSLFQALRPDRLHELQQALSGLHSLSILTAGTATDASNLIAAIAPACTGLTSLTLGAEPVSSIHTLPEYLRILDVLSSPRAFPALLQLHITGLPWGPEVCNKNAGCLLTEATVLRTCIPSLDVLLNKRRIKGCDITLQL
jgi:hypothetical protein